jgi:hypothetical protein
MWLKTGLTKKINLKSDPTGFLLETNVMESYSHPEGMASASSQKYPFIEMFAPVPSAENLRAM